MTSEVDWGAVQEEHRIFQLFQDTAHQFCENCDRYCKRDFIAQESETASQIAREWRYDRGVCGGTADEVNGKCKCDMWLPIGYTGQNPIVFDDTNTEIVRTGNVVWPQGIDITLYRQYGGRPYALDASEKS